MEKMGSIETATTHGIQTIVGIEIKVEKEFVCGKKIFPDFTDFF